MAIHATGNSTWVDYPSTSTLITATGLENIENLIDGLRATLFGGITRSRAPAGYAYLNGDTAYGSGANGIFAAGFTAGTDPDGMVTIGTSAAVPTEVTAPVTGSYLCELHIVSNATTGVLTGRMLQNPNNANTVDSRVLNATVASFAAGAVADGTYVSRLVTRNYAAGDRMAATFFGTTAGTLKSTFYGGNRATFFGMRYLGPSQ